MDALMKDVEKYETTGIPIVDLIANCVYEARKRKIPLRYIKVKPSQYKYFIYWAVSLTGPEAILHPLTSEAVAPLTFGDVPIELGSQLQATNIVWDVWPTDMKKVESFRIAKEVKGSFPEHSSQLVN